MATKVSENEILQCLIKNIEEIKDHKKESGKNGVTNQKTSERDLQFKNESYLNANTIQTMKAKDLFKFKSVCHASMKKEKCFIDVHLCRKPSKVISSHCSCHAGKSGYYNHIITMLCEIADYSLHLLKSIPLELACTSKIRQWGVSGENTAEKLQLWRQ